MLQTACKCVNYVIFIRALNKYVPDDRLTNCNYTRPLRLLINCMGVVEERLYKQKAT